MTEKIRHVDAFDEETFEITRIELRKEKFYASELGRRILAEVWSETMPEDSHEISFTQYKSWWDMFKVAHFPQWLLERFPANIIEKKIRVEWRSKALYPNLFLTGDRERYGQSAFDFAIRGEKNISSSEKDFQTINCSWEPRSLVIPRLGVEEALKRQETVPRARIVYSGDPGIPFLEKFYLMIEELSRKVSDFDPGDYVIKLGRSNRMKLYEEIAGNFCHELSSPSGCDRFRGFELEDVPRNAYALEIVSK